MDMNSQEMQIRDNHQIVMDRCVASCQADAHVVAAFLGGSYARGAADEYSDLDLYLITTDEAYEDFYAGRAAFMGRLGEPVFIEDFGIPNLVFYVFADGSEGELGLGRESEFTHIHSGPYRVLLDKKNILAGVVFPGHAADPAEQTEKLRRLVYWFWHDLSHLITALGRNQLWWAHGQLDELRHYCVKLARFRNNFFDAEAGEEGYFKVEQAIPIEQLASLRATFCPMEKEAMLQSAFVMVRYYQELSTQLAQTHGITYPQRLEQVMVERLENLRDARSS
jgi:predicted nucleotidyltransferase